MSLTPEQIELRRHGLGSSEVAAAIGVAKYASPYDVWARKQGLADDTAGEAATWGHLLEPVIAEQYAAEVEQKLAPMGTLQAPDAPWMMATPDRIVVPFSQGTLLEVKTAGLRQADRWGPSGTEEIPAEYYVQALWQAEVARRTGLPIERVDVAVLIGGQELRLYTVRYDPTVAAGIVQRASVFWQEYVIGGRPPDPAECRRAGQYLAKQFPTVQRAELLKAEGFALDTGITLRGLVVQIPTRKLSSNRSRKRAPSMTCNYCPFCGAEAA